MRNETTSDGARLEILRLTGLLDTAPEDVFDCYTSSVSECLGVPISLVSLVTKDRQFFKSQFGLSEPWASLRESPLSYSFCKHVVENEHPLIVEDAHLDPLVKDNLAVTEAGVRAYAGVPLRAMGQFTLGSLCAIDTQPRTWSEREVTILKTFAAAASREIDLRFAAQQFHAQLLDLQKTEVLRDNMVQMMVHDMRTPLTSLLSGLQTLEEVLEPDVTQKQLLDISIRGGRSLADMVTAILDISRNTAGQLVLDRQLIPLPSLINLAIEQVTQLSDRKKQSLSFELMPDLPTLWGDEEKLCRVLVNFLGNAIQHTPHGGSIKIRVSACVNETGRGLLWCVSDSGCGIAPSDFELIFQKFGQVSSRSGSTGLGLTFCKLVIEAHGGRVWVESTLGHGSQFFFTIPGSQ